MKIGLLGGTFDPVHNGHITLAEVAHKTLNLEAVLFIPAYIPPHKDPQSVTPVEHRIAMLTLALEGKDFCRISQIELERRKVRYTIDTLKELRQHYPENCQFCFLVGSDFIDQYKTWKDYTFLTQHASFYIAVRPGFPVTQIPEGMQVLEGAFPLVASTDLRIIIKNGENVSRYIPSNVYEYIQRHALYSAG